MENPQTPEGPEKQDKGFHLFAVKRIAIATVGVLALLWLASFVLNMVENHDAPSAPQAPKIVADHDPHGKAQDHGASTDTGHDRATTHAAATHDAKPHGQAADHAAEPSHGAEAQSGDAHHEAADDHAPVAGGHGSAAKQDTHAGDASGHGATPKGTHAAAGHAAAEDKSHAAAGHGAAKDKDHAAETGDHAAASQEGHAPDEHAVAEDKAHAPVVGDHAADAAHGKADDAHGDGGHGDDAHGDGHGTIAISDVQGVTFVMATMAPLHHELEERFYGWRPNDIIRLTDNVNNFQLGVLEVTRRTVEALTDSISRTGSVQAFDKDLERARNNLMINADDYMLPSAESSYEDALAALGRYKAKLEEGTAPFYTRTDNLIPLLEAYANLLGSCDDNLVKAKEDDGSEVSFFQTDNYFFYAQGVASAMHTILQAVAVDFATVVESRRGSEVLHHAVEALHHALVIDPWIILDGDPDGFTANHRANLAAPISHARFYVALLVQTLST